MIEGPNLRAVRRDEAGSLEINGRPAGDYTLPGRADIAHQALTPGTADLYEVVRSAKRVMGTLPPEDAQAYKESVDRTFFGDPSQV